MSGDFVTGVTGWISISRLPVIMVVAGSPLMMVKTFLQQNEARYSGAREVMGYSFSLLTRIQCLSAMQNGKTVYGELGHNMKWIFRRTGASGFGFCHVFTVVYMKIRVGVLGHGRNDSSEYDGAHNKKGQDLHEDIDDGKSVFPGPCILHGTRDTHIRQAQ